MPGVRVGDGTIISLRSVVVADVPPYTIVGGNPAKLLRERFRPAVSARLREVAWWNWPIAHITDQLEKIVGGDVEALVAVQPAR